MSKIPDRDKRLSYLNGQLELAKMYVQYWLAVATTGQDDYVSRKKQVPIMTVEGRSYETVPMTRDEIAKDAMITANTHLHRYRNMLEVKSALERDDLKSYEFACQLH